MLNLFRLCRKNRPTCSIRQCCFGVVAGVDGALHVDAARRISCYHSGQKVYSNILNKDRSDKRRFGHMALKQKPQGNLLSLVTEISGLEFRIKILTSGI